MKHTNGDYEKAQEFLTKRQTTFSLDKCIVELGIDEGIERWLARQEKWISSLENKSLDEKYDIIRGKAKGGWKKMVRYNDLSTVYLMYDSSEMLIKFGISGRTDINKRLAEIRRNISPTMNLVYHERFPTLDILNIEDDLCLIFKEFTINNIGKINNLYYVLEVIDLKLNKELSLESAKELWLSVINKWKHKQEI